MKWPFIGILPTRIRQSCGLRRRSRRRSVGRAPPAAPALAALTLTAVHPTPRTVLTPSETHHRNLTIKNYSFFPFEEQPRTHSGEDSPRSVLSGLMTLC